MLRCSLWSLRVVSLCCVVVVVPSSNVGFVRVILFQVVELLVRVGELQSPNIILIESVALERVDDHCRLHGRLEVSKA